MNNQHKRVPVAYTIKNINAIELLGGFRNAARELGWTAAQVEETTTEAMAGDYQHLHRVLAKYCVAPSAQQRRKKKSSLIRENAITLSLSLDSVGVLQGHLYKGGEHLLSTAHPTTLAAAISAMGERKVVFLADTEYVQFPFPVSVADLMAMQRFINTADEACFMAQFVKSSWLDFQNPEPADVQVESHLMAAMGHLFKRLVRNGAPSSEKRDVARELKVVERLSPFARD